VPDEDGIGVARTVDKAGWDAAVAAFRRVGRGIRIPVTLSSVGGTKLVESVLAFGAAEYGPDSFRAILT
jgi:hypothetical protein